MARRILVIDDSPTQAAALQASLESAGHLVSVAPGGTEGLVAFDAGPFDLVICDVVMPDVNGYEVCRRIKASARSAETPVILLTSLCDPMSILMGLQNGADNFLSKSDGHDRLLDRVGSILASRTAAKTVRLKMGVEIQFMGQTFSITSEKQQIVDALLATFEGVLRMNEELQLQQEQLSAAKRETEMYAGALEGRLRSSEEQLRQAQKMEAIGRLAGGVAHDFNNLLMTITGYGELIQTALEPGHPQREDLGEILKAAHRAAGLTRQLLAFARKQILQPVTLDLNEIVDGVVKMLRRVIGEDIELAVRPAPDLWPVFIDPVQIEQVLMNLAVNSRDAMPDGGRLTIETVNVEIDQPYSDAHPGVRPGRYAMIAVTDTGCGMDPATRERIYEPFFTTKEPGKGTGLGLSTVHGIVNQSGGHIWVYSELGHGTTFKVYFPMAKDAASATPRPTRTGEVRGGTETILLVEDDEAVRRLATRVLQERGYTVLVAPNGQAAIELWDPHKVALLITDVVMPKMGGRELYDRLRPSKVIFCSGYTDRSIAVEGVLMPGVQLLEKPFSPTALLRRVREVLDGS